MAHIEDGIGKGVKQVITDHDPDDLHGLRAAGHGKQQNSGDRQQRRRQQQPGPRLALFCMRAVDDIAHDHVCSGVNDFGKDGEYHQKCTAPDMGQLQDIRVINIQVSSKHSVEQQRTGGAKQIPQPFFFASYFRRTDPALKCFAV